MSDSLPPVAKISCDTELRPSEGSEPGTVDHLNEAPQCEHNWVDDYMGDPDVPGGQMFFGYCTKCGASSDSPDDNIFRVRDGQPGKR